MGVRLTEDEQWATLEASHTGIITTLRRDGRPVALPVWFVVVDRKIYIRTPENTKKIARIRHDDRCSFLVESGLAWKELKAVHCSGHAAVLEAGEETDRAAAAMEAKYRTSQSEQKALPDATRKHYAGFVWIRFDPEGEPLSWDNAKIRMTAEG